MACVLGRGLLHGFLLGHLLLLASLMSGTGLWVVTERPLFLPCLLADLPQVPKLVLFDQVRADNGDFTVTPLSIFGFQEHN